MVPICFDNFRSENIFYDLNHEIWSTAVYNGSHLTLKSKYKKSDFVTFHLDNSSLFVYTRVNSKPVRTYIKDVSSVGQVLTFENPLILDLVNKQSRLALDDEAATLKKRLNRVEEARKKLDTDWPFKPKQSKRPKKK